jgi:L-amino acid N-acyltransferase
MSSKSTHLIREARSEDSSSISRIYSEAILARDSTMIMDPVSPSQMEEKLGHLDDRETILVATDAQKTVLGWGIVKLYSDRPGYRLTCETSIFVDTPCRGMGIGSRLQKALLIHAKNVGFHHVLVRIWAQNTSSISLHHKLGFTLVGIQNEVGHVDSKWIDVAVMQCLL